MLPGFTGGSCSQVQLFGPVPGAIPDQERGKAPTALSRWLHLVKALLMLALCRQLILERQEGGNVPVHMPRRLI